MIRTKLIQKVEAVIVTALLIASGLLILNNTFSNPATVSAMSVWEETAEDDFKHGTLVNLTLDSDGLGTNLQLQEVPKDWIYRGPPSAPERRCNHAMTSIFGTDKVLLFGGYGNGGFLSDTWIYDLSQNMWVLKTPSNSPTPRIEHAMAPVFGSGNIVLFGGWDQKNNDNTWTYNLTDDKWLQKKPAVHPCARRDPVMTYIWDTDKVLLYGGLNLSNHKKYGDTWVYDFGDNKWKNMNPKKSPGLNHKQGMAPVWGTDKVVMFGGSLNSIEVWVYDLSDNNWTNKSQKIHPKYRIGHSMAAIEGTDNILLFGGWNNSKATSNNRVRVYDDTWLYDYSKNEWEEIATYTSPKCRYTHRMTSINGTDKILLFGGLDVDKSESWILFDDTWLFTPYMFQKHVNGIYYSPPHDTKTNSSYRTLIWKGKTPSGTALKFQIRTAGSSEELKKVPFVGPFGAEETYYTSMSSAIWSGHENDRYVQYKVLFETNNTHQTPNLEYVWVLYNNLPKTEAESPSSGMLINDNTPLFGWSFIDLDSEIQQSFQLVIDNDPLFKSIDFNSGRQKGARQQWEFPNGTIYNTLPDGNWFWKVKTKDDEGNWSVFSEPYHLIIDSQPPSSAITFPENNGVYWDLETIFGSAEDSKEGSGVSKVEIEIKRLSDNKYWSGSKWQTSPSWLDTYYDSSDWDFGASSVLWTYSTDYMIRSRATDTASNIEIPGDGIKFSIDKSGPTSVIEHPTHNSFVNDLEKIKGTAKDTAKAGIDSVEIRLKQLSNDAYWDGSGWSYRQWWLKTDGEEYWAYDTTEVLWNTDTWYLISSSAKDKLGNKEIPGPGTVFMYDNIPPSTSITINHGDKFTNRTGVILSLAAEDLGSGVSEMAFSTDGKTWTDWESYNSEKKFNLPFGDGEKTVYFIVSDRAGNIAASIYDTIILDTTPPEDVWILMNDNAKYSNSTSVKLTLNAVDTLSGIDKISFKFDDYRWSGWEPFKNEFIALLPVGDGEKLITFKVNDKAGNVASAYDNIVLDTHPPHSLVIVINNGDLETNSPLVDLILFADDEVSGVFSMSFSWDGKTWSSWELFTEQRQYSLLPQYFKGYIYFRVNDYAGNIAEPVCDQIYVTKSKPEKEEDEDDEQPVDDEVSQLFNISRSSIGILFMVIIAIVLFSSVYISRTVRKYHRAKTKKGSGIVLQAELLSEPKVRRDG